MAEPLPLPLSSPQAPRVLGLDLSLTRTGYAAPEGNAGVLRPPHGSKEPEQRLEWVRDEVLRHADTHTTGNRWVGAVDLVAIEGFSFGSRGSTLDQIHGLGWIVRMAMRQAAIPYVVVPPAVLKRYATGRGNADKAAMLTAALKRLGYDTDKPDDNEVDALWLRALALDAYRHPVVRMPQAQRDASVAAVTWPRLPTLERQGARIDVDAAGGGG